MFLTLHIIFVQVVSALQDFVDHISEKNIFFIATEETLYHINLTIFVGVLSNVGSKCHLC